MFALFNLWFLSLNKISIYFDSEKGRNATDWGARSMSAGTCNSLCIKIDWSEPIDRHHIRYDQRCVVHQFGKQQTAGKVLPVEY